MKKGFTYVTIGGTLEDGTELSAADQADVAEAISYITHEAIQRVTKIDMTMVVPSSGEPMPLPTPRSMEVLKKIGHISVSSHAAVLQITKKIFNGNEEPVAYGEFIDDEES